MSLTRRIQSQTLPPRVRTWGRQEPSKCGFLYGLFSVSLQHLGQFVRRKKIMVSDSAPYFVYPRECVFFPDLWRVLFLTGSRARVFVGTWGTPPSTRSDPNFRGPEISSHRSIFVGAGDPSKSGQNPHKTQGHSTKNQKNTPLKPGKTPHYTPRKTNKNKKKNKNTTNRPGFDPDPLTYKKSIRTRSSAAPPIARKGNPGVVQGHSPGERRGF